MAHSIPDSMAIVVETDAGRVLHTGDWKLDHTPVDGLKTDVGALAELGNRGVDLLLGDSTNAERPGMTGSERLVGEAFRQLIPLRSGRIIVASFASNMHRVQQAAEVAIANGRRVAVVGRSMRKNMNIARTLGYVELPEASIVSPKEAMELPRDQVLVLCTGSQGEPMSALHAHRVRRPPERDGRERRHGDHLGEAGPRERAPRARLDQPALPARGGGAAPGGRARSRLGPRVRRGAAHAPLARAAARGDADPRRVPHARGARKAGAGRRSRRRCDRDRGERLGRRADPRRRPARRARRRRASRSSTGSASATWRTSRCATGGGSPRTAC